MKVVEISNHVNEGAIDVLEKALKRVKRGEIKSIALSWIEGEKSICGDYSGGNDNILLWAAIEHTARSFYEENVIN